MRIFCLLFMFFSIVAQLVGQDRKASIDTLTKHVYYLASAEMQGRNTAEEGQRKAAAYIEKQFKQYGLSKFDDNGYRHYYNLMRKRNNKMLVKSSGTALFWPWHFYYVSGYNHTNIVNAKLVFVGYGSDDELEGFNLDGKVVALLAYSPNQAYSVISKISEKFEVKNYFVIFPEKSNSVDLAWSAEYQLTKYNLPDVFTSRYVKQIQEPWANNTDSVNVYYCFPNVMNNIFMMNDKELERVAKNSISQHGSGLQYIVQPQVSLITDFKNEVEDVQVENIAGFIKGADTTQTIVVSAHYDHIGVKLGEVNFGADDNASGTAALLESARLMALDAKLGNKPAVNVLFIAFSGEEMGLLGSKAFVNDSAAKLNNIKLNINMDMLGRWDEKHEKHKSFVYLLTAGHNAQKLYSIGRKGINLPKGFKVSNKPGAREKMIFKSGSDHYSFFKKDIPVSVFFTGLHDDYHTPGDTPDKINYENLTTISSAIYQYIYKTAELE